MANKKVSPKKKSGYQIKGHDILLKEYIYLFSLLNYILPRIDLKYMSKFAPPPLILEIYKVKQIKQIFNSICTHTVGSLLTLRVFAEAHSWPLLFKSS